MDPSDRLPRLDAGKGDAAVSKTGVEENPNVKCPFYKHENQWEIHCEGVQRGQCFHVAFSQPQGRLDYEKRLCKDSWGQCLIARGQNHRWAQL